MNIGLKTVIALVLSFLMTLAVIGCSGEPLSTREKGTLLGGAAGAGAGAGALVGGAVGHPGAERQSAELVALPPVMESAITCRTSRNRTRIVPESIDV
jgi:hypothetical protein